jgi:Uma2 family endonuclease
MRNNTDRGTLISVDEYLALEQQRPTRSEYVYGYVHAMSGTTTRHNRIARNVAFALGRIERGGSCRVFLIDVKVRAASNLIYYPDVVVACGEAANVEYVIDEPVLVVEVTSRSTAATDRREKLAAYTRIPSLQAYLIVDHRRRHAVLHSRAEDGSWTSREIRDGDTIEIPSLGTSLGLGAIYEGVTLPPLTVEELMEDDALAV